MALTWNANPSPFPANMGYQLTVQGGSPPYTFVALPAPPNPSGVKVAATGPVATVTVPSATPSGTTVYVRVTDSSNPPQSVVTTNAVA